MKNLILLFLIGCSGYVSGQDTRMPTAASTKSAIQDIREISVLSFGAHAGDAFDNSNAFDLAAAYVIEHPAVLTIPVGNFNISRPWLLQRVVNGANQFFTIHIKGVLSNKSSSNEFLSRITCNYKSGYGIGIELGRGIVIENVTVMGQYAFPYSVTNSNIATLKFSDWVDPTITDTRFSPYAGISIDPLPLLQGGRGGTSDVTITNCAVIKWMVGVALTPNNQTLNDEMINILDDDIEACRVAIAIGQDQSKTINIKGLKVWASVHTVLDGLHYGRGTGGGSVFCENWNIAGNVNQLFYLYTDRFPLSCRNIYSESLFRIGTTGCGAGANFTDCQIDFLSGPGWPEADYLLNGCANFSGGQLRYYDNSPSHRLNLTTPHTSVKYRDMTLNTPPLIHGLYGGVATWTEPVFDNVHIYYGPGNGGSVTKNYDTLLFWNVHDVYALSINRTNWTAYIVGWQMGSKASVGDYVLGSPASTSGWYYDKDLNASHCPTIQIGRVTRISRDSLFLDCVGLNTKPNDGYDGIYIDKIK